MLVGTEDEAKTQDYESSTKPKAREAEGRGETPLARLLPGSPSRPWQEPCRGNLPNTSKATTLEPESSDTIDNIGTKAREGGMHVGMQIFVKTNGLRDLDRN